MQSKLREIFELCIEKSNAADGLFYELRYSTFDITNVIIIKWENRAWKEQLKTSINEALEYMRNE